MDRIIECSFGERFLLLLKDGKVATVEVKKSPGRHEVQLVVYAPREVDVRRTEAIREIEP